MNNFTERQIEDKLKILASVEPDETSVRRTNRRIRRLITNADAKPQKIYGFLCYAAASAAVLLMAVGLLCRTAPVKKPPVVAWQMPATPAPTRAYLNAVFNHGGQKALDQYLEEIESNRHPRAENLTLQEVMNDL